MCASLVVLASAFLSHGYSEATAAAAAVHAAVHHRCAVGGGDASRSLTRPDKLCVRSVSFSHAQRVRCPLI